MCMPSKMDHNLPQTQKSPSNPKNTSPRQPTGRPRHLLPHRVFFWTPWAPRRLGTIVAEVVVIQSQICHRFVHLEGLSDGLRLRRPADQAFDRGRPWGVMGCTCSCGWVNRKSPLNWLMSTIGEFFRHDCARIHSNFDKVTSRWY